MILVVAGTFAPKSFRSRERTLHTLELSFLGTFAPKNESSLELSSPFPVTLAPVIRLWGRMLTRLCKTPIERDDIPVLSEDQQLNNDVEGWHKQINRQTIIIIIIQGTSSQERMFLAAKVPALELGQF